MLTFNLFSGIIDDEFDDDDVTPPRSPLVVQNSNMGLSSKPLLLRPADNSPFTTGKLCCICVFTQVLFWVFSIQI